MNGSEKWQEYVPEPWKNILQCSMHTTVNSQCQPSQERFGLAFHPETSDNLKERFRSTSKCGINTDTCILLPHKEYMSELMTVEDSSTQFSGSILLPYILLK